MKEELKEFILEELLFEDEGVEYDTSLFNSRLLKSIQFLTLINYLESTYGIKVVPKEMDFNNFDTISKIETYIASKNK